MSGAPYAIGNPRWPADLRRRTFSSRERYRHARIGLPLALVSKLSTAARRLLIGRPFRSDRLSHTLLPKRIALPVFASDAMSSIAYAPEEIFLVLSVAGLAAYSMAPLIGLAVAAVLLVVVSSYRQNVHAYLRWGRLRGCHHQPGATGGLVVASALMVDYVLTVAVSISSAASNIGSVSPFVYEHKVLFAVGAIVLIMAMNLRGVRESGLAFAIPTYAFIAGIGTMLVWGCSGFSCWAIRFGPSPRLLKCTQSTARSSVSRWCSWWRARFRRGVRR